VFLVTALAESRLNMIHSHRLRIVGVLAALSVFVGLAACGGGGGGNQTPDPVLASITLDSNGSVNAGATIQGTATLDRAAKAGGAGVTLTSSNASVATVPGTVFIAEGATSERFTVTGVGSGTATITGNFGGARTASVNVALDLVSVSLSTNSVSGIGTITGTVTLSGGAPTGGTNVGLSSSNSAAASVPSSVTVPQGSATQPFNVVVNTAQANNVTITATLGSTTRTASLAINAVPIVASFRVIPDAGSAASGQQCEVVRVDLGGGNSGNRMRCTFDGGASTPQGAITSYIWRFSTGAGSMAFTRSTPTISGSEFTLPCGSFGANPPVGSAFTVAVTLEIVTAAGNNQDSHPVTFIRNGPCG
jgi:hypothetical protein